MRNASAVAGTRPRSRSSSAAVAASHLWGRGRPGAMAGSDAILENPAKTLQILTACYIGPITMYMCSVVQINVVKCFVTSIMHHATFDHVCLDRRVLRDGASIKHEEGSCAKRAGDGFFRAASCNTELLRNPSTWRPLGIKLFHELNVKRMYFLSQILSMKEGG